MKQKKIKTGNARIFGYWIATSILVFVLLSGGIAQLFKMKENADGLVQLGYPLYLMSLLGFWKILGSAALILPRFPVVTEWAYAGIFFDMTGASFSHMMAGNSMFHIIIPLIIAGIAATSRALRPTGRRTSIAREGLQIPKFVH